MKNLTITIILLSITMSGCSGWTYNGIRGDDLRNFNQDHLLGGIVSFATHTIGHHLSARAMGFEVVQDGLNEMIYDEMSNEERFVFGASGFGLQLLVGYGMKWYGLDNDFTRGYNAAAMWEAVTYPVFDNMTEGSDINEMNQWTNGHLAWGLITVGAIGLNVSKEGE